MIEVTGSDYYTAANIDYRGIPLIEVFPPLNETAIGQIMTSGVVCRPEERTHTAELRIQYVHRLLDFYLPLDHQTEFASKLWTLICSGYRARDPRRQTTTALFRTLCASIAAGDVAPGEFGHFRDSMWSAFLIGTPGTGKSTTPNALLVRLGGDLIHHKAHGDLFQLLFLRVQAPKRGTGKGMAEIVYRRLKMEARKVGLPMPYTTGKEPRTLPEFEDAIEVLAHKLNLGILILDELQHLYSGTGEMDQEAMKFLTGVVNRLSIPILFIGTWQCAALLGLEMRLGRRGTGPTIAYFKRMLPGEDFSVFVRALFEYQFTQKLATVDGTLIDRVYHHTQGVQDLVVKLVAMCQIAAILDGTEVVTSALVDKVAEEHFRLIAPSIEAMRSGRPEDDVKLWDVEPADFDAYLKAFIGKLRLRAAMTTASGRRRKDSPEAKVSGVATGLFATGAVSADQAAALAASAVSEAPDDETARILKEVLNNLSKPGPQPTRSRNETKIAAADARFAALEEHDVRRIVYLAAREKRNPHDALVSAGHVCELLKDAPY